ncbi:MAG: CHAD domain-containing protein [Acidobacteriota bacterium]|nr:CHAD domain-containing protein [Acidobacteriota bacterium]
MARNLSISQKSPAEADPAGLSCLRAEERGQAVTAELAIRLLALLEKMTEHAAAEDVHHLRTTVRRLEVHLPRAARKIARALRGLRKGAGVLRDLDVHLQLLQCAPFTGHGEHSAHALRGPLRTRLTHQRREEEERLLRCVAKVRERLEQRLPQAARAAARPAPGQAAAERIVEQVRRRYARLTEEIPEEADALHGLRIAVKKLRYRLEPLAAHTAAAEATAQLKQVQDAIGLWHDWATMVEIAAREVRDKPRSAALLGVQLRAARELARARRVASAVRGAMRTSAAREHKPEAGNAVRGNIQFILGRAG